LLVQILMIAVDVEGASHEGMATAGTVLKYRHGACSRSSLLRC
jgi:hypothetical protein